MKLWQLSILNLSLCFSANTLAQTVTIPNTFSSGTPAVAAEVNANFGAVKTAVDANDQSILTNRENITINSKQLVQETARITENRKNLFNLQNSSCDGFSYVKGFDKNNNVICSTDLPGSGYLRKLPVFQDNIAQLEIEGYIVNKPVVIISGLGIEIERIPQFIPGAPKYIPGTNMEDDFVIEVNLADEPDLQGMFDTPPANRKAMSLIVRNLKNEEVFRYNLFEYQVDSYTDVGNGRSRFTFTQALSANNSLQIENGQLNTFGTSQDNNPDTDTLIEIEGIIFNFYPQVVDDPIKKTLTLTYTINEGGGLYSWFKNTATGNDNNRGLSVIQQTKGVETSRKNYYEVFPIRWEIYEGFSLPEKIKARIILSYDSSNTL